MPSAYNDFVKLHMLSLGNSIPAKERMVMIGKLWSSAKEVKPTVLDKTDKKDKNERTVFVQFVFFIKPRNLLN